jgi:hypothetical protein
LPDLIKVVSFAMKEFLDFAISLAARETTSTGKVINGVSRVKAFVIEEGTDQSGKAATATNSPFGCHLTNEQV